MTPAQFIIFGCKEIRTKLQVKLNYLKADFYPIESGLLKKFCRLEGAEKVTLALSLWRTVLQCVENVVLQKLLIRDAHFNRLAWWAVFAIPVLNKRYVNSTACEARTQVKGPRSPE
jgi:hypothetical protein